MLRSKLIRQVAFWGLDFLKGRRVGRQLRELEKGFSDPQSMRQLSQRRLKDFLDHACRTTRYYASFGGAAKLQDFPVIQKSDIRERYEDFFADGYDRDSLVAVTTSGSTGTPFTFYLTKEKKARQWAEVIFTNRWVGYDVGVRHVFVRAIKTKSPLKLFLQNEVLMDPSSLDASWLEQQRQILRSNKIRFITGYCSSIGEIAEYCLNQGDRPEDFSVEGIVPGAEALQEKDRDNLEKVFGCKISVRYSTEELGVLAQQRPRELQYLVNNISYVIEIMDLEEDKPVEYGNLGRIVVTDFFSHAMPLIRYDTGDLGVMKPNPQGEEFPSLLDSIQGRKIEMIYNASGEKMSPFAVNISMRDQKKVKQFQFIQKGPGEYIFKLVVQPSFSEESIIRERLMEVLGDNARLKIEYVSSIPTLPSGKRQYIINEMNQAQSR
ncbi:hypothetical protein ACFL02_06065 [Planctomycetota bacterium]